MRSVVVHIVPYLPPQNSGVGDYALLVGRRMEEIGGVDCAYVAVGCNAVELPTNGASTRNITASCSSVKLWNAVKEMAAERGTAKVAVILNYSGYGYERNGCPAWLLDAMRMRPEGVARVVTYFHELYADGWPWQRAFWYSSRQRRIARDIARLSDAVLTNREQSARWLEKQTGRSSGSIASLPVPSNVGEPTEIPTYESRPPRAVAFGGERSKRFALYEEAGRVAVLLKQLQITELVDIGGLSPIDRRLFEQAGIELSQIGHLSGPEVSDKLLECRIGFLDYPLTHVAKSSVFAAYAAHGVVPILRKHAVGTVDGVTLGKQAVSLDSITQSQLSSVELQRIVDSVRGRYQEGCSEGHANALVRCANPAADYVHSPRIRHSTVLL